MSEEKYLTTSEFANAIGISVRTLRRWNSSGLLYPHHKTPAGRWYYSQQQVDAYKKKYFNDKPDALTGITSKSNDINC